MAVVADGMGGLAHGDAASRTAVRSFLQAPCTTISDLFRAGVKGGGSLMFRIVLSSVALFAASVAAQEARFITLGSQASVTGVSADGTIVVGSRGSPSGPVVFRWTGVR